MADCFLCSVCQTRANSISDLHLHQTTCHSISQLSLALLTCRGQDNNKIGVDMKEDEDDNNNMQTSTTDKLQTELSECVTAIDKIMPDPGKKEGRRKKNPKPRRNCKRNPPKKKSLKLPGNKNTEIPGDQLHSSLTKADDIQPIQQPQLSSTFSTPVAPKRSLRKKSLVNYYDLSVNPRVEDSTDYNKNVSTSNKSAECNDTRNNKNKTKRYMNRTKKTQPEKGMLLKSMLVDKSHAKNNGRKFSAKYGFLHPQYGADNSIKQNHQIKENMTWNRVYQNYVQGFATFGESVKIQENYLNMPNKVNSVLNQSLIQSNYENRFILSQSRDPSFNTPTSMDAVNFYNLNSQRYPAHKIYPDNGNKSSEFYVCNERVQNNEFLSKNYIINQGSNSDTRNMDSLYIENTTTSEDPSIENISNFSWSLTSDVKDIIVDFLAQEENERARNPYWEDNMDKYFPSETESSSEVEQLNEKYYNPYEDQNYNTPLNLVMSQARTTVHQEYNNNIHAGVTPIVTYKEFAKCKSTWSSDYIKHQNLQTQTLNNNNNYLKPVELTSAYKYKMFCLNCGLDFYNEYTLGAHIVHCRGKFKTHDPEMFENERILDAHIFENFCMNKKNSSTPMRKTSSKKKQETANNKYNCHLCKKGFANRTKYCKHLLDHKKKYVENTQMLCSLCGLLFENYITLQNHLYHCV